MNSKTIFPVILVVLLAACGVNAALETDAKKVASTAAKIAEFDLPTGYAPEFSAKLEAYSLVSYNTPGDGHSHLYLVQSQDTADTAKLAQALKDIIPGENNPETRMTVIETRTITVRVQETTLVLSGRYHAHQPAPGRDECHPVCLCLDGQPKSGSCQCLSLSLRRSA